MQPKSGNLQRMKDIATDMIVRRAVEDRLAGAGVQQAAAVEDSADSADEAILERQRAELLSRLAPATRAQTLSGGFTERSEKEFFALIEAKTERLLVHFFHAEFEKCRLLDAGLARVAHEHPETLFIRVNALEAPFLTRKLSVKVLPLMVFFRRGVAAQRVEGFEGFGGEKSFAQKALLRRLGACGAVKLSGEERAELGLASREDESD